MLENTALSARRTAMARVRATLLVAAMLAAGCAGSGYTGSEYNGLYSVEPGPYEARIVESLAVFDPVQDREVTLRVIYPDAE